MLIFVLALISERTNLRSYKVMCRKLLFSIAIKAFEKIAKKACEVILTCSGRKMVKGMVVFVEI